MYTGYFGFIEKPFNITPDPGFLYLTAQHQEALATMGFGILEKMGFISIIGEIGAGKTTLIRYLLDSLDEKVETVLIFNTIVNFEQLLKNILWDLDIAPGSKDKFELIQLLNTFLLDKRTAGVTVALIIDEAQNLSNQVLEEIRMLSNLETAKEKLLQIVLVGQPELHTKLSSPDLRQLTQRIAVNCYIAPLNDTDIKNYIAHRLKIAGCKDNRIFSEKALELICRRSKGVPRTINMLCGNALLSAYGKDLKRIDDVIVEEVISDYEKPYLPLAEREPSINPVSGIKKGLVSRARYVITSLACVVVISAFLGLVTYQKNFSSLDNLFTNLVTNVTDSWRTLKGFVMDPFAKNNSQESPRISENAMSGITPTDVLISYQKEEVEAPSKHTLPSLEGKSVPADALPVKKYYKTVFARRGDYVSSLALREYGITNDTICDIIKRANPQIEDLNKIDIGQEIKLPALDTNSIILEKGADIYSIHIATLSSMDEVKQYLRNIDLKEYQPSIVPVKIVGGRSWHRITIGDFSSREEAIETIKSVRLDKLPYSFDGALN
jgi:general secretion pathway protein A